MTDLDRGEEPEDPKVLRSAAVDALKDAARQSDSREFNRLTRHALALLERARATRHGRGHPVSEAAAAPDMQRDDMKNSRSTISPHKIIELFVRLRRVYSWKTPH